MTNPSLGHYLSVGRRALPWLLLLAALATLAAVGVVRRQGPTYEAHFSYTVSLQEREAAPEFRFDGYYALQATDLFAETLAAWATTPEIVVAAHEAAGLPVPSGSARQLARRVSSEKVAPQLVRVWVKGSERDLVERLAQGLQTVMAETIASYHEQGVPAVQLAAVATEPWLGVAAPSVGLIGTAVFVTVLLLGLNAVLLFESVRHIEIA
jgi:hypothetical protein